MEINSQMWLVISIPDGDEQSNVVGIPMPDGD